MQQALVELQPWLEATPTGPDAFSGRQTRRTGGLLARSATCRDLVMHPLVRETVDAVLVDGTSWHIHLTQVIAIGPGQEAQPVHRDQWAFDFFPFPKGYEAQCNTIWAMNDFTEENGATRLVPGSHGLDDRLTFTLEETEAAAMPAGSVLFYTGSLYHGGGANLSDHLRYGLNLTYARSWLRQEENQYLTVPFDLARTFPDELLRAMGYQRGAYALGYVDDLRDPLEALKGEGHGTRELGSYEAAVARLEKKAS
jgi:ectoine hydroxylase-related dioxygenase (phytanoyl-CoA dioxygenase family)